MSVKLLTEHHLEFLSIKKDCTGSSEFTLVKMPHCWKSHVTAHTFCTPSHRSEHFIKVQVTEEIWSILAIKRLNSISCTLTLTLNLRNWVMGLTEVNI